MRGPEAQLARALVPELPGAPAGGTSGADVWAGVNGMHGGGAAVLRAAPDQARQEDAARRIQAALIAGQRTEALRSGIGEQMG